jgi:hypothetical protein
MNNMTDTVKQLLIINVLFFIGSYFVPQANELLSLHYFESDGFKFWQPITHMFMHGSLMHIFFNMFALISFGSALEHFWGAKKFLFFYQSKCFSSESPLDVNLPFPNIFDDLSLIIKAFCNIKNLSGELVKINVHIGELQEFKGGKDDKRAIEIARKKVDDYIQSNLSKFFSEK